MLRNKVLASSRTSSPAQSIKDFDQQLFPDICILLQVVCKIPVSSCECEWNASRQLSGSKQSCHSAYGYVVMYTYMFRYV